MSTQSLSGQKMLVASSLGLIKEMFSVTSFCFAKNLTGREMFFWGRNLFINLVILFSFLK